jgi:hypothetical protein
MGDRHCHVAMDLDNGNYRLARRALELVAVRIGPGAGQAARGAFLHFWPAQDRHGHVLQFMARSNSANTPNI